MSNTQPSQKSDPPRGRVPTPPPDSDLPDDASKPEPFSDDAPLDAVLEAERASIEAEQAGERWVRLDAENLLRAADFRRIKQGEQTAEQQRIEGVRRWTHWPLPALTINDSLELLKPLWTVEELLMVIGAEVVQPPRSPEQVEWILGPEIDPSPEAGQGSLTM